MNLHKIAAGVISAVNPMQVIQLYASNGYTVDSTAKQIPKYLPPVQASAQVQALTTRDLRQLEMLNIQGSEKSIYISGEIDAITRVSKSGGDLIVFQDDTVYLTTHVLEQWPDWCKVSVVLQNPAGTIANG